MLAVKYRGGVEYLMQEMSFQAVVYSRMITSHCAKFISLYKIL